MHYFKYSSFMFLFSVLKVNFKKKSHYSDYIYHCVYLLIKNIYFKMQCLSSCIILLKGIHVRICDQVIVIILSHFLVISNLQNYMDYFVYDNCIS